MTFSGIKGFSIDGILIFCDKAGMTDGFDSFGMMVNYHVTYPVGCSAVFTGYAVIGLELFQDCFHVFALFHFPYPGRKNPGTMEVEMVFPIIGVTSTVPRST